MKKKIQYSVYKKETGNASGKAKNDAYDIALKMGFLPSYNPSGYRVIRIIQQFLSLRKYDANSLIFFQYPAVSEQLMRTFEKRVSKKAYSIALIHDLASVQGFNDWNRNTELHYLNLFNHLIVHNEKMKEYVLELGYTGKVTCLELFDYLYDTRRSVTKNGFSNTIAFAGNLSKAGFLNQLENISGVNFLLYGNAVENDFTKRNVTYCGSLPSDEIQYLLQGDYGLVWDGDSIETCSGAHGKYLLFNNPHKMSLYIAAGKPVITWKKAAIANFIKKNNIGIVVDSLKELTEIDLRKNFEEYRKNIDELRLKVANGYYLSRAIKEAIKEID